MGRKTCLARKSVARNRPFLPPLRGWVLFLTLTHGLRRGLHSLRRFAAPPTWIAKDAKES